MQDYLKDRFLIVGNGNSSVIVDALSSQGVDIRFISTHNLATLEQQIEQIAEPSTVIVEQGISVETVQYIIGGHWKDHSRMNLHIASVIKDGYNDVSVELSSQSWMNEPKDLGGIQ